MRAGSPARLFSAACALAGCLCAPAAAQPRSAVELDLGYAASYAWRGIVLDPGAALSVAPLARVELGRGAAAGGLWSAWDLGRGRPHRLALSALYELDAWAQYTHPVAGVDVTLGTVAYLLADGEDDARGEAYVQIWPRLPRWLELRGTLFRELESGGAAYAEVEASHSFSVLPLPMGPPTLVLGGTAGWSLSAREGGAPSRRAFADEGLAHLDGAVTLVVPLGGATAHLGLHHQHARGPVTRIPAGPQRAARTWGELAVTLRLGGAEVAK